MWDMSWTVRSIVSHSRSGRYVRMSGPRSQTTARTTRHKWDTCTAWWQHWNHNANKEMYDNQIISYSCHNRQEIYQMTQHEISWDSQQAYTLTEFFFIYGMISWLCHKFCTCTHISSHISSLNNLGWKLSTWSPRNQAAVAVKLPQCTIAVILTR